jgi:hypothetical protein
MFSIMSTGLENVLVWFSPGSQAISTLAPHSARPADEAAEMPAPLPLPPHRPRARTAAGIPPSGSDASHTSAFSDVRESSHTQEFTIT